MFNYTWHLSIERCDSGLVENHKTTSHSTTDGQSSHDDINQNKMEAE